MNLLEEACYLTLREIVTQCREENDKLTKIIQADDVLEIHAPFVDSTTKQRLCLASDFIDKMKLSPASNQANITDFYSPALDKYISPNSFYQLSDKGDYTPVYLIIQKIDDYTLTAYSKNMLSIKIHKLSHFDESRYSALISAMQNSGLFEFKRRTPETAKRTYNATRQTLQRRFTIKSYEWSLIFNHDISNIIFKALPRIAYKKYGGTFYLHDSTRSQCKIKIYNIDAVSPERINQPLQFRQGDRLKLEITFKAEYFRSRPELTISKLTHQNTISDLFYNDNKTLLDKHLVSKLNPLELRAIIAFAEVKTKGDFMAIISDSRTTQTDTDKRLTAIERHLEEIDNIARDNSEAIADIKEFIDYKDTKQDKRKLRAVK